MEKGKKNNTKKKEWTQESLDRFRKGPSTPDKERVIKEVEEYLKKKKSLKN